MQVNRLLNVIVAIVVALSCAPSSASAELYKCTDKKGSTQFATNKKLEESGWRCVSEKLPPLQRYNSDAQAVSTARNAGLDTKAFTGRGPKLVQMSYKETENPDVEVGASKQCTVTGLLWSKLQTNATVTVSRPGLEESTFEYAIKDYGRNRTECCFRKFKETLDGACVRPDVSVKSR